MRISVIIPTYKPQDYLWECLDSLKAQTFPKEDYEVVIVLNGCTDPYKSAIEKYIAEMMQGMHVNLIHAEKPGVSNARNIGLDNAKGEYVAFVDDDDILSCVYLEELYNVSSPTCIGCSNSYAFIDRINEKKCNLLTTAYKKCLNLSFSYFGYRSFLSPPWCKLIHRDIIGTERFSISLKKGEDGIFCFAISPRIRQIKLTSDDAIYYQRLRAGSAMRRKNSLKEEFSELIKQEKVLFALWFKHPCSYNFLFGLTRVLGIIRNFFIYIS